VQRIAMRALKNPILIAIAVAAFIGLFVFNIPFPLIIGVSGLFGGLVSRVRPELLAVKAGPVAAGSVPPLISDDALHGEKPTIRRAARILFVGGVLWAAPVVLSVVALGRSHTIVDEGLFFSGTALVTFGGAYAVLSFVAQRAVSVYQWLLPGEMVHGLALAETTPGPLIMVVQFVGFLGAFRNPGNLNPWVAAIAGSTLTVWVTFVPCFLFVFLGAPHIEKLRHNVQLSAALTSITAAVVGVIANLSIYFAVHTLFSRTQQFERGPIRIAAPAWSSLNLSSLLVAALGFALVFHYKQSVLRVLAICAAAGAALYLL
jgi:chromate transporter